MKKFLLLVMAGALAALPLWAFDRAALEVHLRKALNLDTRTPIKAGESEPSDFEGLTKIPVTIGEASYPIYMSKDEKKYVWGNVIDFTEDPDQGRAKLIGTQGAYLKGSPKAPVTVVEFSDLQCPHCRKAHEELKNKVHKTFKENQVRVVFKHFPLSGHDWAEPAAVAVECAGQQKPTAFWEMTDSYFHHASTVTVENVGAKAAEFAKGLKLNTAKFEKCRQDPSVLEKVRADKKEGTAAGVASTPTFFVNGRMRRGLRDFDDLKVLIEEKLAEGK